MNDLFRGPSNPWIINPEGGWLDDLERYNITRRAITGCYYCNDSGVNYKVDGSVVKCGRCFHSPVEFYVDKETMTICFR